MRAVEHGPYSVQGYSSSGTSTSGNLGAVELEHGFDIGPLDVRTNRVFEDVLQRSLVLRHQ